MYFLNINKPKGITSFDVIRFLRKKLKTKAIGHSGTLDPLASGVMQIAVGKATKLLDYLESDKEYIADIKFGYNSTTYDDEGEKTFVKEPNFSKEELICVLNSFIGESEQIPPKYSAIKINGQKLCNLARKNIQVEIKPRNIKIYSIDLIEFYGDCAKIKVSSKKGVYIRSLAYDIGQKLKCGAYLTDLVRIKAGNFYIEKSDELKSENYKQIEPQNVLNLPCMEIDDDKYILISNGNFIKTNEKFNSDFILLTKNNKLVSIAKIDDNYIKPKKFFKE